MIPDFLNDYRAELEALRLESVKIAAQALNAGEAIELKQSKFLGKPYLPKAMAYPHDAHGAPMLLLAQINFAEVPPLPNYPKSGILQLFASPTDCYNLEDYHVIFHENTDEEAQDDFPFLREELYEGCPIASEHRLHFTKCIEYGSKEDVRFNIDFKGLDKRRFGDPRAETIENLLDCSGHKIGGYAHFNQSDPRGRDGEVELLLLQIDVDDRIMFGDSGTMHLFIGEKSLKEKDFSRVWVHGDCC